MVNIYEDQNEKITYALDSDGSPISLHVRHAHSFATLPLVALVTLGQRHILGSVHVVLGEAVAFRSEAECRG